MFTKKYFVHILLIAQILLQQHQSDAIKCYVCGDTNNFLYSTNDKAESPPPVACSTLTQHWNNSKAMEKYITECPKEYHGCITQIQGDQVTRACDIFPLDDCQIANSITYCYCSYDLCNGETDTLLVSSNTDQVVYKLTSSTKQSMINYKDLLDDEDYNIEMSGHGNNDNEDENVQDKIITTSTEINKIKLIETTKKQSTIKINVQQIINNENISTKNNNTENEGNLNNVILIDEDEILTTTEYNEEVISTSIKNNMKIYNKSNLNNSNSINNNANRHLLIVYAILYQQILL